MVEKVELTPQQQRIVEGKGKFVVKACPGSGKTFSVAARIAHLIKNQKPNEYLAVAALSFTNVACEEILEALVKHFGINTPLRWPHFIGTIDSFTNNYIFLPYGHLVMGCKSRPELIGEPHNFWKYTVDWSDCKGEKAFYQFFDRFSFDKYDDIIAIKNLLDTFLKGNFKNVKHHIKATKVKFFFEGKATQADANYIAYKVLNKYDNVSKNLSQRFSHFIIDEAQDTTDVQMGIIEQLENNGAKEIILIGDPNQSIFEWNDAKPEQFDRKYNEWQQSKDYKLNENRRSSKLICDCTRQLLNLSEYNVINENVKNYDFRPEVVEHNEDKDEKLKTICKDFLQTCSSHNIPITQKKVAILYRSHSIGEWLGMPKPDDKETPWMNGCYFVRDIAYGKFLIDNNEYEKGYVHLQRGYHKYMDRSITHVSKQFIDKEIEKVGYKEYRNNVFKFLELISTTNNIMLNKWIYDTNQKLISNGFLNKLVVDVSKSKITLDTLFGENKNSHEDYFIGTIHSAKGKTFEAVLLVVGEKCGSSYYKNILNPKIGKVLSDKQKEEIRNIYVAITRPSKILVIAVPEQDCEIWKNKLQLNLNGQLFIQ